MKDPPQEIRNAPINVLEPLSGHGLRVILWSDLHQLPKREYLVKRLLDRGAISVIYGEPNCGKTFFALDLGIQIALGWEWCGRKVSQGTVIYIAAEGGLGLEERLTAFQFHHKLDVMAVPLYLIPDAVDLCRSDGDTQRLIEAIKQTSTDSTTELVVIDTLSRVLMGGNENAPEDMGSFIANCDRIRHETGAHVMVIHHAGKDASKGARGHSALRAAIDTEIEVTKKAKSSIVISTVRKQRDYPTGNLFAFKLEPVELGMDEDEERVWSCVLIPTDPPEDKLAARITGQARIALDHLQRAVDEAGEVPPANNHIPPNKRAVTVSLWRGYCYTGSIAGSESQSAKQKAFKRSSVRLQELSLIGVWQDYVWIA